MCQHLRQFLDGHQTKINKMPYPPIIERWLDSPGMVQSIETIEQLVAELFACTKGGKAKLREWFLEDDRQFNSITAERYILGYLKQQNQNIHEILCGGDVDAILACEDEEIGIEITTLNGFIADWIFRERLMEFLDGDSFQYVEGIQISYSYKRIQCEQQGNNIYKYIENVGNALIAKDNQALHCFDVKVDWSKGPPGSVSWEVVDGDEYPWFDDVTSKLLGHLQSSSKSRQFAKRDRNLVFVGVNHMSTVNYAFPRVFEALSVEDIKSTAYYEQVEAICSFWRTALLENLQNVIGICFFVYSLDRLDPFYPLKMIWRNEQDSISIVL